MIPKDTEKLLEALGRRLPPVGAKKVYVPGPGTSIVHDVWAWKRTTIMTGDQRPGRINRTEFLLSQIHLPRWRIFWQRVKHWFKRIRYKEV